MDIAADASAAHKSVLALNINTVATSVIPAFFIATTPIQQPQGAVAFSPGLSAAADYRGMVGDHGVNPNGFWLTAPCHQRLSQPRWGGLLTPRFPRVAACATPGSGTRRLQRLRGDNARYPRILARDRISHQNRTSHASSFTSAIPASVRSSSAPALAGSCSRICADLHLVAAFLVGLPRGDVAHIPVGVADHVTACGQWPAE